MASNLDAEIAPLDAAAEARAAQAVSDQPWPDRRSAYLSLVVMTIVVMFTVIDRQVLNLMVDPMKADFHITDTQAALLLGAAFSITYGIAGIPIGRIADTANRRNNVAASLAFWSLCTMTCGIAQNYAGMFLAGLAYLAIRFWVLSGAEPVVGGADSVEARLARFGMSVFKYLQLTLLPFVGLSPQHTFAQGEASL